MAVKEWSLTLGAWRDFTGMFGRNINKLTAEDSSLREMLRDLRDRIELLEAAQGCGQSLADQDVLEHNLRVHGYDSSRRICGTRRTRRTTTLVTWICTTCGKSGSVSLGGNITVTTESVRADHTLQSPDCNTELSYQEAGWRS